MKNNLILFDIDYTLFNVEKYRQLVYARLEVLLPNITNVPDIAVKSYEKVRQQGPFDPGKFAVQFIALSKSSIDPGEIIKLWEDEQLLSDALYPETREVISSLAQKGVTLGIFSSGISAFQHSKIAKIAHFFEKEHIHIHPLKDEKVVGIVKKYQGWHIALIDDYIPVIEKVKQASGDIITIWIKRGLLSEKYAPSSMYPPDFIIQDLREILPILPSLIA